LIAVLQYSCTIDALYIRQIQGLQNLGEIELTHKIGNSGGFTIYHLCNIVSQFKTFNLGNNLLTQFLNPAKLDQFLKQRIYHGLAFKT